MPLTAVGPLRANPNVAYVEEDGYKSYHTDSAVGELQWGVNRIDAEAVWDATGGNTGTGANGKIKVADLDSGIDSDHPDLVANILETWSVAGTTRCYQPQPKCRR